MPSKEVLELEIIPDISMVDSMERDTSKFRDFEKGKAPSSLRIYSLKRPAITLGYLQKAEGEVDRTLADKLEIDVAQRPTGGGILLHSGAEIGISLVMPVGEKETQRDSLIKTGRAIIKSLSILGICADMLAGKKTGERRYCFSYPSSHEVVVGGKKIMGLAQKKGRRGVLQQGTIFTDSDIGGMLKVLKKPFSNEKFSSAVTNIKELTGRIPPFNEFVEALKKGFNEEFGIESSEN